jgi:hypothetical protein
MSKTLTLKPGGACRLPSVVIFVDVRPQVYALGVPVSQQTHTFGDAYMSVCRLKNGMLSSKSSLHFKQPWLLWKMLEECRDRERATWVFGHNIGYDLTLLGFWDWLPASGARLVSCCLDDPPTIITLRWGRRLVRFVDVMNYWRLSVSDLATTCCSKVAQGLAGTGRQSSEPGDCKHDVGVIESCMLRLISHLAETRCSSLRPTAASLSWGVYRKSFQPRELVVSLGPKERWLARQAYYGGRVQEFASGSIRETVHGLDCNSMYPSVMMNNLFPCRLVSHPCGMRPADLKAALRDYDCVADVDLCPGQYPYPCRSSSGVAFVRGCTHAILAGAELRVASAHGDVTKVRDCYLYERADLFSGFVKHFYQRRTEAAQAGNRGDSLIYKMFLNCLHGKFAQRGHKWTPAPKTIARGYYAYWWHKHCRAPAPVRCRSIAGVVEAQEEGEQPKHCFPAISACITANARVVLEDDISLAGPHNVLYCDTDSLHVVASGLERLERYGRVDAAELGRYRVHVSGNSAHYYGRQHYRIGNHTVCSSIKPDAIQISDGVYLQDSYQGVERVLEAGTLDRVTVTPRVIDMLRSSKDAKKKFVQCS